MTYAQDNGYTPTSFAALVEQLRNFVNDQFGTEFTEENFVGTKFYQILYFALQLANRNETKASEIFLKLQEYILQTNMRIQRPSTSLPGIIESFQSRGYIMSVRENDVEDAGTVAYCVDVDDSLPNYPDKRLEICQMLKDFVAAGMVFVGTEEEEITLSNGQEFTFRFSLPDRTPTLLRLTITSSDNQDLFTPDNEVIRQTLFDNIWGKVGQAPRYRLGWDFEPQRYFTLQDAPWAATILLEYSIDAGEAWLSSVFQASYIDILEFGLEDIQVIVDP
jgi:hypothetical protein